MRRFAPWLPLALILAMLCACMVRAVARQQLLGEEIDGPVAWGLPYAAFCLYSVPYFVPMLLLEWTRTIRRGSAAPPGVATVAVALALPALVVAALWPLGVGSALLLGRTLVARTMLADHLQACAAAWAVSVIATALWVLAAACRWVWWPRPVSIVGMPPYRVALRDPPPAFLRGARGVRSTVAIWLVSVGLIVAAYSAWEPQTGSWHSSSGPRSHGPSDPPGWKGGGN